MTDQDPKPLITIGAGTFHISEDAPQLPAWVYTRLTRIALWLQREQSSRHPRYWMGPISRILNRVESAP